jgi:hypothetical protein
MVLWYVGPLPTSLVGTDVCAVCVLYVCHNDSACLSNLPAVLSGINWIPCEWGTMSDAQAGCTMRWGNMNDTYSCSNQTSQQWLNTASGRHCICFENSTVLARTVGYMHCSAVILNLGYMRQISNAVNHEIHRVWSSELSSGMYCHVK